MGWQREYNSYESQVLQNKVAKTILDLPPWNSASDALKTLNITPIIRQALSTPLYNGLQMP